MLEQSPGGGVILKSFIFTPSHWECLSEVGLRTHPLLHSTVDLNPDCTWEPPSARGPVSRDSNLIHLAWKFDITFFFKLGLLRNKWQTMKLPVYCALKNVYRITNVIIIVKNISISGECAWLICIAGKHHSLFFPVLEAEKAKVKALARSSPLRACFLVHSWHFLSCDILTWWKGLVISLEPLFTRHKSHLWGLYPCDLITSQRVPFSHTINFWG